MLQYAAQSMVFKVRSLRSDRCLDKAKAYEKRREAARAVYVSTGDSCERTLKECSEAKPAKRLLGKLWGRSVIA